MFGEYCFEDIVNGGHTQSCLNHFPQMSVTHCWRSSSCQSDVNIELPVFQISVWHNLIIKGGYLP